MEAINYDYYEVYIIEKGEFRDNWQNGFSVLLFSNFVVIFVRDQIPYFSFII